MKRLVRLIINSISCNAEKIPLENRNQVAGTFAPVANLAQRIDQNMPDPTVFLEKQDTLLTDFHKPPHLQERRVEHQATNNRKKVKNLFRSSEMRKKKNVVADEINLKQHDHVHEKQKSIPHVQKILTDAHSSEHHHHHQNNEKEEKISYVQHEWWPHNNLQFRQVSEPNLVDDGMEDILRNIVFMQNVPMNPEDPLAPQNPVEGKRCPTPIRVSRESSSKMVYGAQKPHQIEQQLSNADGNCTCPEGSTCLITAMLTDFTEIAKEMQLADSNAKVTYSNLGKEMKAQVGCPARSKDKVHWHTSFHFYSWRAKDVACYKMREGDTVNNMIIKFENNRLVIKDPVTHPPPHPPKLDDRSILPGTLIAFLVLFL